MNKKLKYLKSNIVLTISLIFFLLFSINYFLSLYNTHLFTIDFFKSISYFFNHSLGKNVSFLGFIATYITYFFFRRNKILYFGFVFFILLGLSIGIEYMFFDAGSSGDF